MFYMKNDDMEEMFRKAADNYELDEEMAADWNNVRAALKDGEAFVTSIKKEKKRRFFMLWWLLLIPGILLITYKAGLYNPGKKQNVKESVNKKPVAKTQTGLSKKENKISGSTNTSLLNTNGINNAHSINRKNLHPESEFNSGDIHVPLANNYKHIEVKTSGAVANTGNVVFDDKTSSQQKETSGNQYQLDKDSLAKPVLNSDQVQNKNNPVLNNNTVQQIASKQKKKNSNKYTRQAFAYIGVMGNADLSFIKFQKTSLPGFGIGIIGGYHFKNGLSIETGLLYDKKNYYTKGKYFNKNAFSYLKDVNLITADGNCHMWELPLNFSYDFISHKKHNWFITSGFSSYFMDREFYNFRYEKNGTIQETANDYYHSSPDWFSVLNIGGGINVHVSDKFFLQAQPYYKIPVSAVGKGNLSLSSGGINVSVKRILH